MRKPANVGYDSLRIAYESTGLEYLEIFQDKQRSAFGNKNSQLKAQRYSPDTPLDLVLHGLEGYQTDVSRSKS